jgi:hypothetical protein
VGREKKLFLVNKEVQKVVDALGEIARYLPRLYSTWIDIYVAEDFIRTGSLLVY